MDLNPKVFKTIVFIRHGQYRNDPQRLTSLGKAQSQLAASAVKPLKPIKLYSSTMPRAIETAKFIAAKVKLKLHAKSFFCEGLLPGTVEFLETLSKDLSKAEKVKLLKKMKLAKYQADEAFKFIFKIPNNGQSCEVVVAHGNVIRHWVCKALKISEEKWLSMDVINASLTAVRIDSKGKFTLLRFSDCGHIPFKMRTYL